MIEMFVCFLANEDALVLLLKSITLIVARVRMIAKRKIIVLLQIGQVGEFEPLRRCRQTRAIEQDRCIPRSCEYEIRECR